MNEDQAKQIYINPPVVEYSHQNPHPLFGKDSNILNAQGHTEYPKWIYPNGDKSGVLVNDAKHEKEILTTSEKHNPPMKSIEERKQSKLTDWNK